MGIFLGCFTPKFTGFVMICGICDDDFDHKFGSFGEILLQNLRGLGQDSSPDWRVILGSLSLQTPR